jgi:hypothetical protein
VSEVLWTLQAQADLAAIRAFISQDSLHYASVVVARLIAAEVRGNDYPAIRMLCVVNRGLWYCDKDTWHKAPSTYELEEVVRLLGFVMDAFGRVAESRRRPKFTGYLVD